MKNWLIFLSMMVVVTGISLGIGCDRPSERYERERSSHQQQEKVQPKLSHNVYLINSSGVLMLQWKNVYIRYYNENSLAFKTEDGKHVRLYGHYAVVEE